MKYLIAALLILTSFTAHAATDDWEMNTFRDGSVYLRLKANPAVRMSVMHDSDGAKVIAARPHDRHKQIEIVEYFAGEHGTSQLVRVYHAAIFDVKNKKLLGEFPLRYEAVGVKTQPPQPKWSSDASSIRIFVPDTGRTSTVEIR